MLIKKSMKTRINVKKNKIMFIDKYEKIILEI